MLKDSSRQGIFQAVTFWGMCALMCGTFLAFLIGSGWLLAFSNESREKTFLVPLAILFAVVLVWRKHCKKKRAAASNIISSLAVSLLISILFMLYVFLPWWLPGYTGGSLLP